MSESYFRPIAKSWAKEVNANPVLEKCDYLFFPGYAHIALFLSKKIKVIFLSDATAYLMMDYYWYNINKSSKRMALYLDVAAVKNALINIRSSQWAVNSLINEYQCKKNNCYVLEFGPNIDTKDIRQSQPYKGGQLQILFSGIDWNRKGGDMAVSIVETLRSKGYDIRLVVVGPRTEPQNCKGKPYIDYYGYLNKNIEKEYFEYIKLFQRSHLFLLPTKAECSAIVYSEAAAAGLPCYTYLTGGAGNYVINGLNGYAFPEGSSFHAFVDQIVNDIETGKLMTLGQGALKLYKEKLNWETWSKGFSKIIQGLE